MNEPHRRSAALEDDAVTPVITADMIRARLERQGIRAEDVEDAMSWARATPDSA